MQTGFLIFSRIKTFTKFHTGLFKLILSQNILIFLMKELKTTKNLKLIIIKKNVILDNENITKIIVFLQRGGGAGRSLKGLYLFCMILYNVLGRVC